MINLKHRISLKVSMLIYPISILSTNSLHYRYDSKHNQDVKLYFVDTLTEKYVPKYSPKRIKSTCLYSKSVSLKLYIFIAYLSMTIKFMLRRGCPPLL